MSDDPDIYAELLGIPPGARPPDFYRLLGAAPFEADPIRINAATKRQVARLSPLLNGPWAEQAKQLIAEIATARAALTSPEVKERYDAKLRNHSDAQWYTVVPQGPAVGTAPPASVDPALVKETRAWPPAEPAVSEPDLETDRPLRWAHQVAEPPPLPDLPVGAPTVAKARLVSGPGTAFSSVATPCTPPPEPVAVAAAMPLVEHPPTAPWPQEAIPAMPLGLGAPIGADAYPAVRRPNARRRDSSQVALIVALVCIVGLVAVLGGAALTWQSGASPVAQNDENATGKPTGRDLDGAVANRAGKDSRASRSSPSAVAAIVAKQSDNPRSEPKAASNDRPAAGSAGNRGMPTSATASPRPADQPAAVTDDPVRAEAVSQSIKAARKALAARDLAAAEEQIDLALVDASSDALRARVDGERALHHYVERFWNAARESAKTLDTGHEFEVDGRTVIVVEISRDKKKLVLRSQGQNRDYAIEGLPADVAAGLAERWLAKDDVNSKVFVGAFLAIDAQGNPERGRRLLSEAKSAGSDAAATALAGLDR